LLRQADELIKQLAAPQLDVREGELLRAVLAGRDALAVGDFSAAAYESAALLLAQPTLIVVPSLHPLRQHIEALLERKISAIQLDSKLNGPERAAALTRLATGGALLVFATSDVLQAEDFRAAAAKCGVGQIVVQEAHCASELSHELRPSYADLRAAFSALGAPPVLAVTRALPAETRAHVQTRLGLRAPELIAKPAIRANITLQDYAARADARQSLMGRLVNVLPRPGLILCATSHDVDALYASLRAARVAVHRCHAGMPADERISELALFASAPSDVIMVATSAFAPGSGLLGLGEGVDDAPSGYGRSLQRQDLRSLVHHQSPASLEQYVHELDLIGRAGEAATAVMVHDSSHASLHQAMLAQQRFRPVHLMELGRGLESVDGQRISVESLALVTGQSRRTTDRLTALLADAGLVEKSAGWIRAPRTPELAANCERLGTMLHTLRERDARRLAAVTEYAETAQCKAEFVQAYFDLEASAACGRCSTCDAEQNSELVALAEPGSDVKRRTAVHEFSVSRPGETFPADRSLPIAPLTAKTAEFSSMAPRP
jgi:ATP-dependent DNA helicase RecQ